MPLTRTDRPAQVSLSLREIEQLQEVVIRAHYLALELRDMCAPAGVAPREMSLAVADMVKSWALAFGEGLRRIETDTRGGH
jgi:hypothetical protein